jgi:HTH-type transcriptional regulator / antitoxin HigA
MEILKYKVITGEKQYDKYCKTLEKLVFEGGKSKQVKDEIALLTVLIEKWDEEHSNFKNLNPVELLQSLMDDHKLKAIDLANILEVSRGLVSEMLNYKRGFSKEIIRTLASHFKVSQEAFNRAYKLDMQKHSQKQTQRRFVYAH